MEELALRLHYGDDLLKEISKACKDETGIVLSGVGCVYKLHLRLAKAVDYLEITDDFEITSLTGTISHGKCHIHGSFSDSKGNTIGGHLCEGCLINTTCELVIGILESYDSIREFDEKTGYDEIVFRRIEND